MKGMERMKSCCVTGPRDIPKNKIEYVRQELRRETIQAIEDGFTGFFSSMAKGTDLEFAAIVAEKKKENTGLLLEAVIPHADRMKSNDKRYRELIRQCSSIKLISHEQDGDCYFATNRYLTENSQRVIAVSDGRPKSNTAQIIRMATTKGLDLRIIDISEHQNE